MKYLLLFSIGPVQSFINQSRKTADLFSSSQILSSIIKKTIAHLPLNSEVIFPNPNLGSMPNRFLAIVETDNPSTFGKTLEETARGILKSEAQKAYNVLFSTKELSLDYKKHIDTFLQVHWAFQNYSEDTYSISYSNLESELGAIKNMREFEQLEESGKKCSLCGERNFIPKPKGNHRILDRLEDNENLCGVCFTKRFFKEKKSFPSTAEVALLTTLHSPQLKQVIDAYKENFEDSYSQNYIEIASSLGRKIPIHFEEQLLYEENLTEKYLKNIGSIEPKKDIPKLKEDLKSIQKKAKENNIRLSKYYALLIFDGDNMGKWLGGTYLKDKSNLKSFHIELSKKLAEFANIASNQCLTPEKGKAVYAGGDDFMGLINLDHLAGVLKNLRTKFNEIVNVPLKGFITEKTSISFSAGIVIAYYKTPFSEVLKAAREAEKKAKGRIDSKDSLAISLQKHSGEVEEVLLPWYLEDKTFSLDAIEYITKKLIDKTFSNNFIHTLDLEFSKLMGSGGKIDNIDGGYIDSEIQRLLGRSYMGNKDSKKTEVEDMSKHLEKLYSSSIGLKSFICSLSLCDFLKREVN